MTTKPLPETIAGLEALRDRIEGFHSLFDSDELATLDAALTALRGLAPSAIGPSTDLLPCPCCGYRAAIEQVPHEPETPQSGGYYIECKRAGCGITTRLAFACKDDPLPSLRESWNRRAPLAAAPAPAQEPVAMRPPAGWYRSKIEEAGDDEPTVIGGDSAFMCEAWSRRVYKCETQCDVCFRKQYDPAKAAQLAVAEEGALNKDIVELAQEVDLTLGGHPAYKLTISSGRVHTLAKEILRLAGKDPFKP